jgi:hypothetical protein
MNSDAFFAFSAMSVLFPQVGVRGSSPIAERAWCAGSHVALHLNVVRSSGA